MKHGKSRDKHTMVELLMIFSSTVAKNALQSPQISPVTAIRI